jgi:hypothetical protein
MSQAIYGVDGGGMYQVTRQPVLPLLPIGPTPQLFLALAAVAAIGGGIAAAYLRGAIQGIFVSPRELEEVFELPVVGTVSWEPAWVTTERERTPALTSWARRTVRSLSAHPRISSNVRAS